MSTILYLSLFILYLHHPVYHKILFHKYTYVLNYIIKNENNLIIKCLIKGRFTLCYFMLMSDNIQAHRNTSSFHILISENKYKQNSFDISIYRKNTPVINQSKFRIIILGVITSQMSFGHFVQFILLLKVAVYTINQPTNIIRVHYIEINTWPFPYQPRYQHETQSSAYMVREMTAGMILKRSCVNLFIIYFRQIVLWSK
jgi:hypothetical protein